MIHTLFFLFQMTANLLVFVAVNLVGLFVHNLMEHAQRKAFLDTRNCIAARLEMEDENEKLVGHFLSFCSSFFACVHAYSKCAHKRSFAEMASSLSLKTKAAKLTSYIFFKMHASKSALPL